MSGDEPSLYLLAATALDRLAFRLLLRTELRREIAVESDFEGSSILRAMRILPAVALVLTDRISFEVRDGVELISDYHAGTRVLVVSEITEKALLQSWHTCRIDGYVAKHAGPQAVGDAIDALVAGSTYFTPTLTGVFTRLAHTRNGRAALSRRELDLLLLLARGLPLRQAAERMKISYKTADSYRTSMLRKLDIHDRVLLARYAIRERLIEA